MMEGVPASRNYAGGFASKLMVGDLAYFSLARIIIEKEFWNLPAEWLLCPYNIWVFGLIMSMMNIIFCMMQAKDLNLAATSAKEVGLQCPLTYQAQEM